MTPQRIELSRVKGWRMPPNTVKVDRTTVYGNPFVVRCGTVTKADVTIRRFFVLADGPLGPDYIIGAEFDTRDQAAADAVQRFRAYVAHPGHHKLRAAIAMLRGKNLACWCEAGSPCHANVLLEIANA